MQEPSLAGTTLDPYYHVCAFFGNRDDEYRVLAPFYRETLEWGEKLLHIVDERQGADHETRLEQHGINVCDCRQTGQLQIYGWTDTYLTNGAFDQQKMLIAIQNVIDAARSESYPRVRIMGNMGWVFDRDSDSDHIIEFEMLVNEVLAREKQPAICVYDLNRMTGAMMMDVMRAHPLTLVNGVIHRNPFFTPPAQMLLELAGRKKAVVAFAAA